MKKLRKIVSLLLAVVMMMSMAVAVSATTQTVSCGSGDGIINITEVSEDATYAVYKMLNLSYDEVNDAYTYTIADDWYNFFTKAEYDTNVLYVKITEGRDSQGNTVYYVTWNENVPQDTATLQAFAQAAETYAGTASISPAGSAKVNSGTTELSFTGLDLGYYFVTSTVGSLVALNSTATTADIVDKNDKPNVDKSVSNDGGATYDEDYVTADIDDEIYFKIIIQGVDEISELVLHDDLPAGYTLNTNNLTVKLYSNGSDNDPATLVADTDYTYATTTNISCTQAANNSVGGCDFELDFKLLLAESTAGKAYYDKVLSLTSGADEAYIEVIYKVTVDSTNVATNSVVTDTATANTNTAYITSSTGITKSDTASVYYFELYIYKYTTDDGGNETALADADFALTYTDGSTYYAVVTGSDGEYTLSEWTTDSTKASTLTTNDSGIIHVIGLDEGRTYTFTETEAPEGYALLSDTFDATITATDVTSSTGDYVSTVTISGTTAVDYGTDSVYATKVLNTTNSAMPSTGGIGVTIFYVLGGVIVVAAVVLIVVLKKRTAKVSK